MAKKEDDCTQCHYYCRVEGRHACDNIPQLPGMKSYKFLKSLNPCEDFWGINVVRGKTHA